MEPTGQSPVTPTVVPTVRWALFGVRGRIGRQSYILGQLFMLSLFAVIIARIVAVRGNEDLTAAWGLAFLALLPVSTWSVIALTVKRLHDIDRTGLFALVLLLPTINALMILGLMIVRSQPEANRYGAPPYSAPPVLHLGRQG